MADIYRIRVEAHLAPHWSDWFEGLELICFEDGTMDLVGPVIDQAALHGLLTKIRDFRLTLISVNRMGGTRRRTKGKIFKIISAEEKSCD